MGNESPKAQISGGKAASFANALRTTRSTYASQRIEESPWRPFHLCSGYQASGSEKSALQARYQGSADNSRQLRGSELVSASEAVRDSRIVNSFDTPTL
jgi:hypothetical protein